MQLEIVMMEVVEKEEVVVMDVGYVKKADVEEESRKRRRLAREERERDKQKASEKTALDCEEALLAWLLEEGPIGVDSETGEFVVL